jgi:hypothetical protein
MFDTAPQRDHSRALCLQTNMQASRFYKHVFNSGAPASTMLAGSLYLAASRGCLHLLTADGIARRWLSGEVPASQPVGSYSAQGGMNPF